MKTLTFVLVVLKVKGKIRNSQNNRNSQWRQAVLDCKKLELIHLSAFVVLFILADNLPYFNLIQVDNLAYLLSRPLSP